ncbi:MAG: 50S ribosomal protein L5 [bacterium]|nr:50S ribosomal protein L5 [bacterium]
MPRLKKLYRDKVAHELSKQFGYSNIMQVPRLLKIVVNMGVGEGARDIKALDAAVNDLALITGQKPIITRAKKSIANFKIRAGMPVGCKVTLRGARMYEFFDRLVNIAIPRIRDFRGLSPRSFDGRGSYTFGIREQLIFPEIDLDKVTRTQGMDITIVTTAKTDQEARELLRRLGMPFAAQ